MKGWGLGVGACRVGRVGFRVGVRVWGLKGLGVGVGFGCRSLRHGALRGVARDHGCFGARFLPVGLSYERGTPVVRVTVEQSQNACKGAWFLSRANS